MSRAKRASLRDRRPQGAFVAMPLIVLRSEQWAALPADAVKALIDMLSEYRLSNNGDLSTAWSSMKARGWRSKRRLYAALDDLERAGFIVKTRQGGSHRPTLWGVTLYALDPCDGKLDTTPAEWERTHRGLWARTRPLTPAADRRPGRNGALSGPSLMPKRPTSVPTADRKGKETSGIGPPVEPIMTKSPKVRSACDAPLKNYHLPDEAGRGERLVSAYRALPLDYRRPAFGDMVRAGGHFARKAA
ncbi:MAG: hypothetical protein J0L91_02595 [Burkholderiales bacterium]|nr:hypothetical protein [Burkholderiales bacterium]